MNLSIVIGLIALAVAFGGYRTYFWYREGQKMLSQDGYLPPHPTWFGQGLLRLISKVMTRLFVGPVKVIGRENAKAFTGRLHILPNHQFPLDFMVVGKSLPYGFRHLGTAGQMSGGVRGTLAAMGGLFAVRTEAGKATEKGGGEKAVSAMGLALARHKRSRVLTFAQGKLVGDNVLRPEDFRTGVIRANQKAIQDHGVSPDDIAVLPMAIHYMRDPRQASWMHQLIVKLGWRSFRTFKMFGETTRNYGAVVAIGKPIKMSELPADPREAIEVVRRAIEGQLTEARVWANTQLHD
jgi:1-acyl-sn-glycerol-3-phosphate acyltransferase